MMQVLFVFIFLFLLCLLFFLVTRLAVRFILFFCFYCCRCFFLRPGWVARFAGSNVVYCLLLLLSFRHPCDPCSYSDIARFLIWINRNKPEFELLQRRNSGIPYVAPIDSL